MVNEDDDDDGHRTRTVEQVLVSVGISTSFLRLFNPFFGKTLQHVLVP